MPTTTAAAGPKKDWINILFLALTPILGGPVLIAYTLHAGFALWMPLLLVGLYALVGLSICAGYHRFFSHKSYECSPVVQVFYAVFGAMAAQNSILRWSSEHRRHHAHAETDWDPYSITRGFWWAHILWIFYDSNESADFKNVRDLVRNPVVAWQHKWYRVLLVAGGFVLPALIGALFGDALAGLLWGGFLRIVVVHHSTFLVNSLAHSFGRRTYDADATARDNWFVALLTLGEGYHSFHHRFPSDFRNGVRWYHWDPAKWFIAGLKYTGLAHSLRQAAKPLILHARKVVLVRQLEVKLNATHPSLETQFSEQFRRVREALDHELAAWHEVVRARKDGIADKIKQARARYDEKLQRAQAEWQAALDTCMRALSNGTNAGAS